MIFEYPLLSLVVFQKRNSLENRLNSDSRCYQYFDSKEGYKPHLAQAHLTLVEYENVYLLQRRYNLYLIVPIYRHCNLNLNLYLYLYWIGLNGNLGFGWLMRMIQIQIQKRLN